MSNENKDNKPDPTELNDEELSDATGGAPQKTDQAGDKVSASCGWWGLSTKLGRSKKAGKGWH